MAGANTSINIAELDFDLIKSNFKSYLQNQDTFKDYDFEGSSLSIILDILAYNTHYNAFYLNMVANEMFLDTAIKRSSAISHAKLLNYTPRSTVSPRALINITFTGVSSPDLTIPKYTKFYARSIDNINYPFVNLESLTVTANSNIATFNSLPIYQGQPVRYSFTVNKNDNPSLTFKLPDSNIDLSTLRVVVYPNSGSTTYTKFETVASHLTLNPESTVYFVQESLDGYYEIYFGDGILGKTLNNNNIVAVEYLITKGVLANGSELFTLMDDIGSYSSSSITLIEKAIGGLDKESLKSIKFTAPKAYAAQNRAVTKSDYISLLENNTAVIPIEAVNVWGGDEMNPPQYGKMFICIKPQSGYTITQSQKFRLLNEVIKPISIITTIPEIVDVDYTFIKFKTDIVFDKSISIFDPIQFTNLTKSAIINFCNSTLNTFTSTFILPDFITTIKSIDPAIITTDTQIILQKRFSPIFNAHNSIKFEFETALEKGTLTSNYFDYIVPETALIVSNCKIEETPTLTTSVDSATIINAGTGYTGIPTVTILGDGKGATAIAEVVSGKVESITITNHGTGYTQAIITISGGSGSGAAAIVNLSGNIVTLRSYYYNNGIKTILQSDVGTIDYNNGIVNLINYQPYNVEDPLGRTFIDVSPVSSIIGSAKDKILSLDIMDKSAISLNVISK